MMPVYQIDIEKTHKGKFWTNRYLVIAETMDAAQVVGGDFVDAERTVTASQVIFTKWRVSDFGPSSPAYRTLPLNAPGFRTVTALLPLFCVVRVDVFAGDYDPGRKYLHGCLGESDQDDGDLTQVAITFFQNSYAEAIREQPGYIIGSGLPPDGQRDVVAASIYREVGMRQLRRGSKRKTTAILTS